MSASSLSFGLLVLSLCLSLVQGEPSCDDVPTRCSFAIVGAGPGGTFTAYYLTKMREEKRITLKDPICLFEMEEEVGGRWKDVEVDGGAFRAPMGGMRWYQYGNSTMSLYTHLAKELGITASVDSLTDIVKQSYILTNARGNTVFNGDFQPLITKYNITPAPGNDNIDYYYSIMGEQYCQNPDALKNQYSTSSWCLDLFGPEPLAFLQDTDRYRSDWQYPQDPAAWMDGVLWDAAFDGPRSYPYGGMSAFARNMTKFVEKHGGLVKVSTKITEINYSNGAYTIHGLKGSQTSVFTAEFLSLAVPGNYFKDINGNIMDHLKQTPQYAAFLPNPVVTVAQVWPYRWWETHNPAQSFVGGQAQTTDGMTSYAHLFTAATPYEYSHSLTRSVFCDDIAKVKYWKALHDLDSADEKNNKTNKPTRVSSAATKGLAEFFPDIPFSAIPEPTQTIYQYWESGWSWLKAGALQDGLTNEAVTAWASGDITIPSLGVSKCHLFMPTDSWNVRMSGWGIAAWQIAADYLKKCHNYEIDTKNYCNPLPDPDGKQDWCSCTENALAEFPYNCMESLRIPAQHKEEYHMCSKKKRRHRPKFNHRD